MSTVFYLATREIKADEGRFQLRATTSDGRIGELAGYIKVVGFDPKFPLLVWNDGVNWVLLDGFHRFSAARRVGVESIPCTEFTGTKQAALTAAYLANKDGSMPYDKKLDFKHAAKRLVDAGVTQAEAARVIGVPSDTLKSWVSPKTQAQLQRHAIIRSGVTKAFTADIRREEPDFILSNSTTEEVIDKTFGRRDRELAEQKAFSKRLERELEAAELLRDQAFAMKDCPVEPEPPWVVEMGTSSNRGVPTTIWSDWHYGEVIDPAAVGGHNAFNKDIARARIKRLVDRTIELSFRHMGDAAHDYPGIVVMLGGDMISGDLHEELLETNDRTPYEAIVDLQGMIAQAFNTLLEHFPSIFVPCVIGNHGRGTDKPRFKGATGTSFEWMLYKNLEAYFAFDKRVTFLIPDDTDALFSVAGHRYLLTHGDKIGTGGGDGIIGAIGPVMRGNFKIKSSTSGTDQEYDTCVMGHWHSMLWLPGVIVNNSLKGYDEYSRGKMRVAPTTPSQALWFTHPKHGITARWEVLLEDRPARGGKTEWVEVTK